MRSLEEETKFHSMKRGPIGSPPSSMTLAGPSARISTGWPGAKTSICPSLRSEEHTSELQSLMRISYAVFCLKKKKTNHKRVNILKNLGYKESNNAQHHRITRQRTNHQDFI